MARLWPQILCTLGLCTALAAALSGCGSANPQQAGGADAGETGEPGPLVVLMIGDGMGRAQLDAASLYRHGSRGQLYLESLPNHGQLRTGSLSGIVDSAAAATTMATGLRTYNGRIGQDRHGQPAQTLVERARARGQMSAVVTTSYLSHATPASFTAHHTTRHEPELIAMDQARDSGADIMLGGGAAHFLSAGSGEMPMSYLEAEGYTLVRTRRELELAGTEGADKLIGLFAEEHMSYQLDKGGDSEEPTLAEMSLQALDLVQLDPEGAFVMIEGARIDMASHESDLERTIDETLAFDDAVRAVVEWAEAEERELTLIITADHECGGLEILSETGAGTLPEVSWRWDLHTNTPVDVYGMGPGSEHFQDQILDHRWIHAALVAALEEEPLVEPGRELVPDGDLSDLRLMAAEQELVTGFGEGFNQLDALYLDADEHGLSIGVHGAFEWDENAVLLFIDREVGAPDGLRSLQNTLQDEVGQLDRLISSLDIESFGSAEMGADLVVATIGGMDPHIEDRWEEAGLRGLVSPFGASHDLGWHGVAINFGDGVRTRGQELAPRQGQGLEAFIEWATLYPESEGAIPTGARVAVSALLVNSDGSFVSNQALPSFAPGTENIGSAPVVMPAPTVLALDADGDGIVDSEPMLSSSVE